MEMAGFIGDCGDYHDIFLKWYASPTSFSPLPLTPLPCTKAKI